MGVRTWLRRGVWQRVLVVVGLVVVLVGAGTVAAAARVSHSSDRILAGVRVAGVDVGGMTRQQATAAVTAAARRSLDCAITVRAAGRSWRVTRRLLGDTPPWTTRSAGPPVGRGCRGGLACGTG
jgi:hypothetical protein